jgi:hypothetical protein
MVIIWRFIVMGFVSNSIQSSTIPRRKTHDIIVFTANAPYHNIFQTTGSSLYSINSLTDTPSFTISEAVYTPNKKYLLLGGGNSPFFYRYDTKTLTITGSLSSSPGLIDRDDITVRYDSKQFAIVNNQNPRLKIYDTETLELLYSFNHNLVHASYSNHSNLLAMGTETFTIILFNTETFTSSSLTLTPGMTGAFYRLAWSYDDEYLILGYDDITEPEVYRVSDGVRVNITGSFAANYFGIFPKTTKDGKLCVFTGGTNPPTNVNPYIQFVDMRDLTVTNEISLTTAELFRPLETKHSDNSKYIIIRSPVNPPRIAVYYLNNIITSIPAFEENINAVCIS